MPEPDHVPDIDYTPPQPVEERSPDADKKLMVGCTIGCFVAIILAAIGIFVALKMGKEFLLGKFLGFTEKDPIAFAPPPADPPAIQALVGRVDGFTEAIGQGKDVEPLILTGDEINLLINHHPGMKGMAGHAEVFLVDDRFTLKFSLPMDTFVGEMPEELQGRFLNGDATIRFALVEGKMEAFLVDLKAANQALPEKMMADFRSMDLFEEAEIDAGGEAILGSLEVLEVRDGKLRAVPKKPADRPPLPAAKTGAAP